MNNRLKPIILSALLVIFALSLHAQWDVPDIAKNMKSPSEPSFKLVKAGKDLYYTKSGLNCVSCHGDPSMGNNKANINSPDLGSSKLLSSNTPGELVYKIQTGMGAMPSFANIHSEDDIWNIAFYIKSFDENFKIAGEKVQAFSGIIDLKVDEDAKKVFANITVTDSKGKIGSTEGVEIQFYVKRYFGNLPVGVPIPTNQVGTAALEFPDDIPGDEDGKVVVIADFKDKDTYGSDIKTMELNWGEPLHFVNETLERTLWGPNNRVPIWLSAMYWFITIGVWLGIFYVIFQITRIKKAGRK